MQSLRQQLTFYQILKLLKQRVSFFGIFNLYDQLEIRDTRISKLETHLEAQSQQIMHMQAEIMRMKKGSKASRRSSRQ